MNEYRRAMRNLLLTPTLFSLFLFGCREAGAQSIIYLLDFTDPSTYYTPCGKIVPPMWEVSNEVCWLSTTPMALPTVGPECGVYDDVPFMVRVNQSGNLECNDTARFEFSCAGGPWQHIFTLPGCGLAPVVTYYYDVACYPGALFSVRVTYATNHNTEKWQLRDNDIMIFDPCAPVILGHELVQFAANQTDQGTEVYLELSQSRNIVAIDLEKSFDNEGFASVTTFFPEMMSTGSQFFMAMEPMVAQNTYYRLKMQSVDGSVEYSHILSLKSDGLTQAWQPVVVNGNPFGNELTLSVHGETGMAWDIRLLNAVGQEVDQMSVTKLTDYPELVTFKVDRGSGSYIVKASSSYGSHAFRVVRL